jgi:hypothetical protein
MLLLGCEQHLYAHRENTLKKHKSVAECADNSPGSVLASAPTRQEASRRFSTLLGKRGFNFRVADDPGVISGSLDTSAFPDTYPAVETEMALAERFSLNAIVASSRR